MTYPSMRDENGVKPPHGSLDWWMRFLAVYGTDRLKPLAIRPDTASRAEAGAAIVAFNRRYPELRKIVATAEKVH